jgi:hypothetical protein
VAVDAVHPEAVEYGPVHGLVRGLLSCPDPTPGEDLKIEKINK